MAGRLKRLRAACFVVFGVLIGCGTLAQAQQLGLPNSEILTISSDRMFAESAYGKQVSSDIEAQGDILGAENRRIEIELITEERELTERRPEMKPEVFRGLADAFNAKVEDIRRTQDDKARALVQLQEEKQVAFFQAARPILADLMRESGASVVLERSSIFLSATAIDITDMAIGRLDATLGDGTFSAED